MSLVQGLLSTRVDDVKVRVRLSAAYAGGAIASVAAETCNAVTKRLIAAAPFARCVTATSTTYSRC
jgi:hypothetical protein